MNPLLTPFEFNQFELTGYFVFNSLFMLLSLAGLSYLLIKNLQIVFRPAALISLLTVFLFQMPLVLFSSVIEKGLQHHWFFAFTLHLFLLTNILWLKFT